MVSDIISLALMFATERHFRVMGSHRISTLRQTLQTVSGGGGIPSVVNGHFGECIESAFGTSAGTNLGLLLFLMYLHDIPQMIFLKFADDLVLLLWIVILRMLPWSYNYLLIIW